ncbi:stage II sporulation protein M [Paenibacillus thiaminolyticus]|uniref:stage II sporulation protein M n=1 Tax=Paenibacillus thiaminolyticus TaxID=49283 RepID=UPI0035A6DCF9
MIAQLYSRWKILFAISAAFYAAGILAGILSGSVMDIPSFAPMESGMWDIFKNNVVVGLIIISSGLITGGVLSSIIILCNGYIIGYTMIGVTSNYGLRPIMEGLVPHFFPESMALMLCAAMGFSFGKYLLLYMKGVEQRQGELRTVARDCLVISALFILLLLLASFIEAHVSAVMLEAQSG